MAFLETIGQQRPPQSQARVPRYSIIQNLTPNDAPRAIQIVPTWTPPPPQNDSIHPAAIWCAVLFVVGAVVTAGWLAKRNAQIVASQIAADAQSQLETPVGKLATKPRAARPQAVVRRGARTARVANEPRVDTVSEVPVSDPAPVNQPAKAVETGEIVAPSIVPIPEDAYVYSGEGGGVVAPRLTSLGFVRRLVSGLKVRTSSIELVVSKSGTVERAKIFSTPAHWEDALLLSRAKTFQFVPAYRNGFPVRYRFVMDVDTSP
jgi:hypothetical protein